VESYKRGIVFSTSFSLLAKSLSFVTNLAVAYFFGAHLQTDIYFLSYAAVTSVALFFTSLNSSVLIPESMRLFEQEGPLRAMKFMNLFLFAYIGVGVLCTGSVLLDPIRFYQAFSRFDSSTLYSNQNLLLLTAPLPLFMLAANTMMDILASRKYFTIPMLMSMLTSLLSLVFILLLHDQFGMVSMIAGMNIAYVLQITLLGYLLFKNLHWRFHVDVSTIRSGVWRNIAYALVGNGTSMVVGYYPLYLLSALDAGSITVLSYSQRLADLPNSLVIAQVSSVVGIKFNELFARKAFIQINDIFLRVAKSLLFILVPVSVVGLLYSREIVTFALQRGSFDVRAAQSTASYFALFSLLLPMIVLSTLVSRLFMASQKIRESLAYQVLFNLFLLALIRVGIGEFGAVGYPIALIAMQILNMVFCYGFVRVYFKMITPATVIIIIGRLGVVNLLIGLVLFGLKSVWVPDLPIVALSLGMGLYLGMLMLSNHFLHLVDDLHELAGLSR
jgi:putative peptidoglycan lipid II flippase